MGSGWPVPTWNLLTGRQSLQAASMKLPAELSASVRAGATLLAMMGDQSRCKRGVGELIICPSGRHGKRRAADLFPLLAGCDPAVGRGIPEHRIADARELVGQSAGRLVVVGPALHLERPVFQAVDRAACLPCHRGRPE